VADVAEVQRSALDGLEAIAESIRRDSPFHARRVGDEAFALAESAAENPLTGGIVPELANHSIRERFLYSHRMLYRVVSRVKCNTFLEDGDFLGERLVRGSPVEGFSGSTVE
jgi:plasmid stabilization system protein ParE